MRRLLLIAAFFVPGSLAVGLPIAGIVIAYRIFRRYRGERELARTLDLLRTHSHVCAATEERV